MHEGRVPLQTIRADIDYGFTEARTTMGRIGVKVWLYKGDVLPELEETKAEELGSVVSVAPEAAATTEGVEKPIVAETPMAIAEVAETPKTEIVEPEPATKKRAAPKVKAPKALEAAVTKEAPAKPVKHVKAAKAQEAHAAPEPEGEKKKITKTAEPGGEPEA